MLYPFTIDEQKDFTNRFWKCSLKSLNEKKYADTYKKQRKCLREIETTLSSFDENTGQIQTLSDEITKILESKNLKRPSIVHLRKLRDEISELDFSPYVNLLLEKLDIEFANVPLHLEMLVEVITEKKIDLKKSFGLLHLYKRFVEIKFKRYLEETGITESNAPQAKQCEKAVNDFQKHHVELAANIYLGVEEKDDHQRTDEEKKNLTKPGLLKLSELNEVDKDLEFVHSSYGEYFYTQYLAQNIEDERVQQTLFGKLLLENGSEFIRKLFNGQLECEEKPRKDWNLQIFESAKKIIKGISLYSENKEGNDEKERTILHVLIKENLANSIRFVFDMLRNDEEILKNMISATDSKLFIDSEISDETREVLLKCIKEHFEEETLSKLPLYTYFEKVWKK